MQGVVIHDIDPISGDGMVRVELQEWRGMTPHSQCRRVRRSPSLDVQGPARRRAIGAGREARQEIIWKRRQGLQAVIVLFAVLALVPILIAAAGFRVVRPLRKGLIEFLGRYQRTVDSVCAGGCP